jgi:guanylate kinase
MINSSTNNYDPLLILFYGPSGSGKTTCLNLIGKKYPDIVTYKKASTRQPRSADDDIISIQSITDIEYDYIYIKYGNKYAIKKEHVNDALSKNRHIILICTDFETLKKIKEDYLERCVCISLFRNYANNAWKKIMEGRGFDARSINIILERNRQMRKEFEENVHIFDATIVNSDETPPEFMLKQFDSILQLISRMRSTSIKLIPDNDHKEMKKGVFEIIKRLNEQADIVDIKPNFFGIGINMNEVFRRTVKYFKNDRKRG